LLDESVEAAENPEVDRSKFELLRVELSNFRVQVGPSETRGIPELAHEPEAEVDVLPAEGDIGARGGTYRRPLTEGIGPILAPRHGRVDVVAE